MRIPYLYLPKLDCHIIYLGGVQVTKSAVIIRRTLFFILTDVSYITTSTIVTEAVLLMTTVIDSLSFS